MNAPVEGTVYNFNGSEQVWWVDRGEARPIPSMEVFRAVFGGGEAVSYDNGPAAGKQVATGSCLVKGVSSDTIYLFDLCDGISWVLREVPTMRTLYTYNLRASIVSVPDEMIKLLPQGPRFPEL